MKDALPDLSWMKEYMPEQTVDALTKRLSDLTNSVSLPDTVRNQKSFFLEKDFFGDCFYRLIYKIGLGYYKKNSRIFFRQHHRIMTKNRNNQVKLKSIHCLDRLLSF